VPTGHFGVAGRNVRRRRIGPGCQDDRPFFAAIAANCAAAPGDDFPGRKYPVGTQGLAATLGTKVEVEISVHHTVLSFARYLLKKVMRVNELFIFNSFARIFGPFVVVPNFERLTAKAHHTFLDHREIPMWLLGRSLLMLGHASPPFNLA
jgi:hypothetical protein